MVQRIRRNMNVTLPPVTVSERADDRQPDHAAHCVPSAACRSAGHRLRRRPELGVLERGGGLQERRRTRHRAVSIARPQAARAEAARARRPDSDVASLIQRMAPLTASSLSRMMRPARVAGREDLGDDPRRLGVGAGAIPGDEPAAERIVLARQRRRRPAAARDAARESATSRSGAGSRRGASHAHAPLTPCWLDARRRPAAPGTARPTRSAAARSR